MGFEGLIAVGQSIGFDINIEVLNFALRAVITIYGINGICHFYSVLPDPKLNDEDEVLHTKKPHLVFWFTTSLIYFFYGLSQLTQPVLLLLTFVEMISIIITYAYLFIKKELYCQEKEDILKKCNRW